ncbi:MAG: amino acid ABC transporter ATP-binding protein [Planctomycetes bacterium]|nr:amino acid ABC transporter ATP-binding protein [Planctomycetota bacterium]
MQRQPHVEFRGVTKRFGDRLVLDAVSLTVHVGETVVLIGPSGGGKSTLLRCINGLAPFESGEIQVGNHRITANGESKTQLHEVRRTFGMVFQDFQLFPHLTAVGNVMEAPRRVLGRSVAEARPEAVQLLSRVGLADRTDAYPSELSGGQKQRVAIARALAMQPVGLLCDEITSALDPELKGEVLGILETLKQQGLTLLVVTHEMGFARRAADRVVVLADGRIVESGPPEQIFEAPQHKRTRQFLRKVLN